MRLKQLVVAIAVALAAAGAGFAVFELVSGGRPPEVLGVQVTPSPRPTLPPAPERGLVYQELERRLSGACGRIFALSDTDLCTHGPDPAPEGVHVEDGRAPEPVAEPRAGGDPLTPAGGGAILCDGDGSGGNRVQAIYARPAGRDDRYAAYVSSIRTWAAEADGVFARSAAKTGGVRNVRFVHDANCVLSVDNVVLSSSGADTFDNTISELQAKGYNRTDRVYLVWMDAAVYCGIATLYIDDSAGSDNRNNRGPGFARVDAPCWGAGSAHSVEAHELMHMMGGVQPTAPHGTYGHCTDDHDRMCYKDSPDTTVSVVCPDAASEGAFDCNGDDYFHTHPSPGSYLATRWNAASSSFLVSNEGQPGLFRALSPARILDTRDGTGGAAGKVAAGGTIDVQVTGRGGVPSSGVGAVVLNVTVTEPSAPGYLTVFPSGVARPLASNLNFIAAESSPNLVQVRVGSGGRVSVFNSAGSSHVIVDVGGYYADGASGASGRFRPLTPARLLDSRDGTGGARSKVPPQGTVDLQVTGRGGVPSTGVGAVVLNVTVTEPTAPSWLTVYPAGAGRPLASNLNFSAGETVPNRVVVKLGSGGKVSLYNDAGSTNVIVDVNGWYTDASGSATGGTFTPLTPSRILDTRDGTGAPAARVGPGQTLELKVTGRGGVPASGASAVVLNVTATEPTASSYLTVWPGGTRPLASDLNYAPSQTIPNLVVVRLSEAGTATLYNASGATHLIADVAGWYA